MGEEDNSAPQERQLDRTAGAVLLQLAERCEREEPSRSLDADIAVTQGWKRFPGDNWTGPRAAINVPCYTTSLDAAVTLVPPNTYWMIGKGKESADEPLYGAIIETALLSRRVELGVGESDKHEALALCAAALRARAALQEDVK